MEVVHSSHKALKQKIVTLSKTATMPLQGSGGTPAEKGRCKGPQVGIRIVSICDVADAACILPFSGQLRPSKYSCIRGSFPLHSHWLFWRLPVHHAEMVLLRAPLDIFHLKLPCKGLPCLTLKGKKQTERRQSLHTPSPVASVTLLLLCASNRKGG